MLSFGDLRHARILVQQLATYVDENEVISRQPCEGLEITVSLGARSRVHRGLERRVDHDAAMAGHDIAVFEFLRRRKYRGPEEWRSPGIRFIAEKQGKGEDMLKDALRARFSKDPRVRRAYLMRVEYPERRSPMDVALCLAAPDDLAIVKGVGEEFGRLFGASQNLDVLFLTEAQERDVAALAAPFYSAISSG